MNRYYEQGVAQILSTVSTASWTTALSGALDISTQQTASGVTSDDDEWCFINGLNAKYKIILDLIVPVMVCILMAMIFVISRCVFRTEIVIMGKAVNFEAAGLAVFLFIIGKVLDTLLKMMSCQSVGTQSVHFYFGFEDCYQATFFVSIFMLMFIALSFGAVFLFARKLTEQQRADPNRFINKLSKRFKPRYWYWEYVLFVRRLVIAHFAVGSSEMIEQLVFIVVMMMFIGIQWKLTPFLSTETNQAEYVLLCGLPIVITAKILSVLTEYAFPADFLSAMVLLPIPVMAFYVVRIVMKEHRRLQSEEKELEPTSNHIEMQSQSVNSDVAESPDGAKRTTSSVDTVLAEPGSGDVDHIDDLVTDIATMIDIDDMDMYESEMDNEALEQNGKM